MFVQAVVPMVTLAQVHCFVVVVEVDLRIFSKFTVVRKQDARKVIDGPVANGYRRSSSTVNFVEQTKMRCCISSTSHVLDVSELTCR